MNLSRNTSISIWKHSTICQTYAIVVFSGNCEDWLSWFLQLIDLQLVGALIKVRFMSVSLNDDCDISSRHAPGFSVIESRHSQLKWERKQLIVDSGAVRSNSPREYFS